MINYFITIKNINFKYTSLSEIMDISKQLKLMGGSWSSHYCIELDSLFRLHMHTMVSFAKTPWFKRFKIKNWIIHFCKIKDMSNLDRIYNYMNKENTNIYEYEQADIISYSHFNNMFT